MQVKQLDMKLSVTSQITPADIPAIASAGFKGIMCNRPDGEEAGQPQWKDVAAAAQAAGLEVRFIPVSGRDVSADAVHGFASALTEIDGTVLAYCRTGTRCEILWNASRQLAGAA